MAITRVWGTCNTREILFEHTDGDRWSIQVPAFSASPYLIEIFAEDTAGNIGYVATVLVSYDPRLLRMTVEFVRIGNEAVFHEIFCSAERGYHRCAIR